MIKVLVVEDSPVIRDWLVHILQSDPELEVIGTASNGEHALQAMQRLRPDVITMDIHMPKCCVSQITPGLADATLW
jgi:two-component system, chemotaxis family, protein-glutamate methylesterase/glutaminase